MKAIYLDFEDWEECGPEEFPAARLMQSVAVVCFSADDEDRVPCHVEAIAVVDQLVEGEDGPKLMVAAHDDFQNTLDTVVEMVGECRPQTVRIGPHRYVLSITPFG